MKRTTITMEQDVTLSEYPSHANAVPRKSTEDLPKTNPNSIKKTMGTTLFDATPANIYTEPSDQFAKYLPKAA